MTTRKAKKVFDSMVHPKGCEGVVQRDGERVFCGKHPTVGWVHFVARGIESWEERICATCVKRLQRRFPVTYDEG